MGLIRAALRLHSKLPQIVYALQLSAGHGAIATMIRNLVDGFLSTKAGKEEQSTEETDFETTMGHEAAITDLEETAMERETIADRETEQRGLPYSSYLICSLLDLVQALASCHDTEDALLQAGIIDEAIRLVKLADLSERSALAERLVERMVHLVDTMLHRSTPAFDRFIGVDGLGIVVRRIQELIASETDLLHHPSSILTALLRLMDRVEATYGGDDRLRSLPDGPLFRSLRTIFEAASQADRGKCT